MPGILDALQDPEFLDQLRRGLLGVTGIDPDSAGMFATSLMTGDPSDIASTAKSNANNTMDRMQADPMSAAMGFVGAIKGPKIRTTHGSANVPASVLLPNINTRQNPVYKSKLFDVSKLEEVPDVPQHQIERYVPARGAPDSLRSVRHPTRVKELERRALIGEQMGGRAWYNTDPLKEEFMQQHGEAGADRFKNLMDSIAATSPGTPFNQNLKRGSLFHNEIMAGRPVSRMTTESGLVPPGYGALTNELQIGLLDDLQKKGTLTPDAASIKDRPKIASFTENLQGNQTPATLDRHHMALLGVPRAPKATEYPFMEQDVQNVAKRVGMTPAQTQASAWMTGKGVVDPRPFMEVFEKRIEITARDLGITPAEALRGVVAGKIALRGAAGATVGAGLLDQVQDGGD